MPATNKIDRERVKQLLAKGLTQTQIAMRLGCTKSGLSTAIKDMRREEVLVDRLAKFLIAMSEDDEPQGGVG